MNPGELQDGSIDAVIEPEIKGFKYRFSAGGITSARITYQLTVHRRPGESSSLRVNGHAKKVHSGKWWEPESIWSNARTMISAAMREAGTRLLFVFNGLPRDGDWYANLKRRIEDGNSDKDDNDLY